MPLLTWEPTLQPMRTSIRALPPPDAPPSQGIVTLGQVRCGHRTLNEYVDSPRPRPIAPLKTPHLGLNSPLPPAPPTPVLPGNGHTVSLPCRTNQRTSTCGGGIGGGVNLTSGGGVESSGGVVSTQPSKTSPSLKEEAGNDGAEKGDGHSSIICAQCGKCRCSACSEPRELPVRWCCGDRYEVSAHKAVDVCTCFCCVQTLFYHCCGTEEDNACYDDPCACGGSKCCSRWACLSACALLLPCLWCYWPLRGCLASTKACYNCCRQKGCQCSRQPSDKNPSNFSQTRRLLMESESSSSSA